MTGKTCLVTGATSGIGKETALGLARLGAVVAIVARDRARGEAALADIKARSGNDSVTLLLADLSSQRSVRRLAREFASAHSRLDVLVNNAGAIFGQRTLTEDGIEATFALNHLGYFLLTILLLDMLKTSAPARIVIVASRAHQRATLDFDDLQNERSYREFTVYGQSKLANVLFTYELARRLEGTGVTVNCMHPGVVGTGFGRTTGSPVMKLAVTVLRPFLITPAQGAETALYLASSPEVEGVSGRYFVKKRPVTSSPASYDTGAAQRLWELSEAMVSGSQEGAV